VKAFAPLVPTSASLKTIIILQVLHPSDLSLLCSDSLMKIQPEVVLDFIFKHVQVGFIH
jgi:hypothetical protein